MADQSCEEAIDGPFRGGVKGLGSGPVPFTGDVVAPFGAFSQKKGAAVVNRWIDRVVGSRIIVRGPHKIARFAHKFARAEKNRGKVRSAEIRVTRILEAPNFRTDGRVADPRDAAA